MLDTFIVLDDVVVSVTDEVDDSLVFEVVERKVIDVLVVVLVVVVDEVV